MKDSNCIFCDVRVRVTNLFKKHELGIHPRHGKITDSDVPLAVIIFSQDSIMNFES